MPSEDRTAEDALKTRLQVARFVNVLALARVDAVELDFLTSSAAYKAWDEATRDIEAEDLCINV